MEDTRIIALYFSRSESAIEETAKKYDAYLNQTAYHILRCREDTEEIVEDTYFAAWNAIPPEKPRVLKHFLSRITRNLAFNRLDYRNAQCRDTHMITLLSELDACIPDQNADVDSIMEAKQLADALNRFLSTLEQKDCGVFLCRYYYCMTVKEVAEKYALTERNAKYRLSCLRRQLQKFLDKEGIVI